TLSPYTTLFRSSASSCDSVRTWVVPLLSSLCSVGRSAAGRFLGRRSVVVADDLVDVALVDDGLAAVDGLDAARDLEHVDRAEALQRLLVDLGRVLHGDSQTGDARIHVLEVLLPSQRFDDLQRGRAGGEPSFSCGDGRPGNGAGGGALGRRLRGLLVGAARGLEIELRDEEAERDVVQPE